MAVQPYMRSMVLLAGNSHKDLAHSVANRLGIPLGECKLYQENCGDCSDSDSDDGFLISPSVAGKAYFAPSPAPDGTARGAALPSLSFNKETKIRIGESVRGKDVFILQTGTQDPNNMMMELLIMAYACKTSCAQRIVGVVPYLPYSKQCRMRKRGSIPCQLFANMMVKSGIQHLITMDLHMKEIMGFFSISVDNLRASSFLIQELKEQQTHFENVVVVARHPGQARRATAFAERLRTTLSVIHGGERFSSEKDENDGRSSPPLIGSASGANQSVAGGGGAVQSNPPNIATVDYDYTTGATFTFPTLTAKKKPPISVVGDVMGKLALIVEDIIDDVEGFCAAARFLKEAGALEVKVMCTHGLLTKRAINLINQSSIDEIIITNTVPNEVAGQAKIKVVDVSVLLSEGIRRIHHGESMSYLFRDIPLDD